MNCIEASPKAIAAEILCTVLLACNLTPAAKAQDPPSQEAPSPPDAETGPATDATPVMFPHPQSDRIWISGQANIVSQWHPSFTSPYAGMNSLSAEAQNASSRVLTLFTGLRLTGSLALRGYGFLLGDGRLRYGRETAEEAYYTVHFWRGAYPSIGVQHINNSGYNRDRGPVVVPSLRLHLEF